MKSMLHTQGSKVHVDTFQYIFIFFLFSFLVPACEYQVSPGRSKSLSPCVETRPLTLSRVRVSERRGSISTTTRQMTSQTESACISFYLWRWREAHVFLQTTSLIFHLYRARSPSILIYFTEYRICGFPVSLRF
jgi:hypothetical protein